MKTLLISIEKNGVETPVGVLQGESGRDAVFTYNQDYLLHGEPISVSLPLQSTPFDAARTRCFFEGLLPEGFSRKAVAQWIHTDENDYLTILAALGKECLGAIRILDQTEWDMKKQNEEGAAAAIVYSSDSPDIQGSYQKLSLGEVRALAAEGASKSTQLLVGSHLSLAGASGKVGLYLHQGEWYQPFGSAPSTHIVKQSHVRLNHIVENELLCTLAAAKLGLPTVRNSLINTGNFTDSEILLASARYDRDLIHAKRQIDGLPCPLRLHQEDFAQALGISSGSKYEPAGAGYLGRIFRLLREVTSDPIRDERRLLDLLIFDVLIGNTDNHIKNLSLLYQPDLCSAALAPAYDLICTVLYKGSSTEMSIAIAGEKRWDKISRQTFEAASPEIGISRRTIAEEWDRLSAGMSDALESSLALLEEQGLAAARPVCRMILQKTSRFHSDALS